MTSEVTVSHRIAKWLDECHMAISGAILATREWRFLVAFAISFVVFGTLMNLLSGSSAALDLFWATDISGKFDILGNAFLANFGVGKAFLDWFLTFLITVLQSVLIGLVVLVWQKRRRHQRSIKNIGNVSDAGLAAGLAILGSGCPTCGTTLLAPVISTFASSGGYVLAGVVSGLLTVAAVLLALFALKRVGKDAYVMILNERFEAKHQPAASPQTSSHHSNQTNHKEPSHD